MGQFMAEWQLLLQVRWQHDRRMHRATAQRQQQDPQQRLFHLC